MIKTLLTAATLAAVFTGVHNASERRAEYLAQESEYYSCIESGLSRAECKAGVGW